MPSIQALGSFAALALVLIVIPGPSVMFVVGRAISVGRSAALLTVAGNAVGVYAQVLLVAVGLGAVVEHSMVVFTAVKLVGSAYLIWLGLQSIRQRRTTTKSLSGGRRDQVAQRRSPVLDGIIVGIANPKSIIFLAAILPQFVEPSRGPVFVQMALLGAVFAALALLFDSIWGLSAGTARHWLAGSPRRLELLSAVGGTAMIGLGVRLATVRVSH